jgi:SMC interacting uncharacterized protein involved in chromosome segregation
VPQHEKLKTEENSWKEKINKLKTNYDELSDKCNLLGKEIVDLKAKKQERDELMKQIEMIKQIETLQKQVENLQRQQLEQQKRNIHIPSIFQP